MPHTFKYNDHIITEQLIKTDIVINLFIRDMVVILRQLKMSLSNALRY
jgi:hypothetical protein